MKLFMLKEPVTCVKSCSNNNTPSETTTLPSEVNKFRRQMRQLSEKFSNLINVQLRPGASRNYS